MTRCRNGRGRKFKWSRHERPSAAEPQPKTISREGREGGEGKAKAGLSFVCFASVARPTAKRICAV